MVNRNIALAKLLPPPAVVQERLNQGRKFKLERHPACTSWYWVSHDKIPWGSAYPENRKFDENFKDMKEVWDELRKRGLWIEFVEAWVLFYFEHLGIPFSGSPRLGNAALLDAFVDDLVGQTEMAITVLTAKKGTHEE